MTSAVILFLGDMGSQYGYCSTVSHGLFLFAIFFRRIGNFLAGELFGRVTSVPWGMVFPHAVDGIAPPSIATL